MHSSWRTEETEQSVTSCQNPLDVQLSVDWVDQNEKSYMLSVFSLLAF